MYTFDQKLLLLLNREARKWRHSPFVKADPSILINIPGMWVYINIYTYDLHYYHFLN